jgi:hypothetical protein
VAVHLWRHLLIHGLEGFDQTYYLGAVPVPGRPGVCDVLVASLASVECHFLFDSESGQLIGMEMFGDEHSDPCEIYFYEYEELEGRHLPRRWEVRCGDELYGIFEFSEIKLAAGADAP